MKRWKKYTRLLLALCLSLTACGDSSNDDLDTPVVGNDWRVTGVVRGSGTIIRDGEDTDVLVCVHKSDATFYHDTEDQELFDSVDYPITLEGDASLIAHVDTEQLIKAFQESIKMSDEKIS